MIHIDQVRPNDLKAAVAYYRQCRTNRTWNGDEAEMLFNRQDNPQALLAALAADDDRRDGDWNEGDHPRAANGEFGEGGGKFADGGGGGAAEPSAADHARATASLQDRTWVNEHAGRLSRAGDAARQAYAPEDRAKDEAHAAAQTAIHDEAVRIHAEHDADAAEEKATRDDEDRAIAAGHVSTESRDIADGYEARCAALQSTIDNRAAQLNRAQRAAADALADLHEYAHDGNDGKDAVELEHTHELTDNFNDTRAAVSGLTSNGAEGDEYTPAEREKAAFPDTHIEHPGAYEEYDPEEITPQQHAEMLVAHADYTSQVSAHEAEFARRAEVAQSALERLHEHQVAAMSEFKRASRDGEKAQESALKALDKDSGHTVNEQAFAHHERDEETGEFHDEAAQEDHDRAHRADESMRAHATGRVEDRSIGEASDALSALDEERGATKDAIRELSKITHRAPRR